LQGKRFPNDFTDRVHAERSVAKRRICFWLRPAGRDVKNLTALGWRTLSGVFFSGVVASLADLKGLRQPNFHPSREGAVFLDDCGPLLLIPKRCLQYYANLLLIQKR
jgi:hypothetical protein